jgi:serine/threonine protein kinase
MQSPISAAGQVVGTVPYMAPEQVRGEAVDTRTDLFALGIMMYELASGRRPFTGQTSADVGRVKQLQQMDRSFPLGDSMSQDTMGAGWRIRVERRPREKGNPRGTSPAGAGDIGHPRACRGTSGHRGSSDGDGISYEPASPPARSHERTSSPGYIFSSEVTLPEGTRSAPRAGRGTARRSAPSSAPGRAMVLEAARLGFTARWLGTC